MAWRRREAAEVVAGTPKPGISSRDWVIVVLSALTLASTSYQFYFKEHLSPQRKPTALEVQASMQAMPEQNGRLLVQVTVRAANASDRRVYVPAMWFSVLGVALPALPCLAQTDWQAALVSNTSHSLGAFNPIQSEEPVAQRRLLHDGTAWFEPKDSAQYADVVALPAHRYAYLKLRVEIIAARDLSALVPDEPIVWATDQGHWYALPRFRGLPASAVAGTSEGKALQEQQIRWADEAAGGSNVHEVVLPLAGAAGASGPHARVAPDAGNTSAGPAPCPQAGRP